MNEFAGKFSRTWLDTAGQEPLFPLLVLAYSLCFAASQKYAFNHPNCCVQAFSCQTQSIGWQQTSQMWNLDGNAHARINCSMTIRWKFGRALVTTFFSMLQFDFYAVFALRRWKASNMLDGICIGCQKPTTWLNEEGALGSSFRILGWKLKTQTHMIHHDSYPTLHATWYPQPSFWASGFLLFDARTV